MPVWGQGRVTSAPLRLLQCLDTASDQQELSRDYGVGVQLAMQAVKGSAWLQGREVRVEQLAMDGSDASLADLMQRLRREPALLGFVGNVGERMGLACIAATLRQALPIAHIAPWVGDQRFDSEPQVVNLFASRETRLQHALRSLESVGIRGVGLVYDGPQTQTALRSELEGALGRLTIRVQSYVAPLQGQVEALVTRFRADLPPVLLFAGGSIELARFANALAMQGLQRYLVSLADADLTLLTQLGAARSMPLVLTHVVPNPQTHTATFVRDYRRLLDALYDDAPSPLGLAGFVAGRYAADLLRRVAANPTRAALLDEVRRRPGADIDGYLLRFDKDRPRGSQFVTQIMIGRSGRLLGQIPQGVAAAPHRS